MILPLWLALVTPLLSQEIPKPPPPVEGGKSAEVLRTLIPSLTAAEQELDVQQARLAQAFTPDEKAEIAVAVDQQRERVSQLRDNFRTLSTGVEEGTYLSEAEKAMSWQENLEDIIAPISQSVREMTAGPRQMAELRKELVIWKERKRLSDAAMARLDQVGEFADSEAIKNELEGARKLWGSRQAETESRIQVLTHQIEERERNDPSTWEAVSGFFADFWRSRGLNLLLALTAAVTVFILTRRIYRTVRKISPLHRKGGSDLAARSADLLGAGLSVLLALLFVILVFYLRGDWLLLTLTILAILGILWASKEALPPYLDQIRMILNIGPVRQGERLVFEGIPWRVDRLNFYCEFKNPDLSGGLLRLPIQDVMPLHSRPVVAKEPWFPTQEGNWVKLEDGVFGKVIQQTPDQVVVLRLGGSLKTIPTRLFLEQNPENLSHGFRIAVKFGIDYQHQPISTTRVPEIFQRAVQLRLVEAVEHENLRSVKVEFAHAAASSLDYTILADFTGEVAARMNVLERLIHKTCLEVCNEHGWVVPFTQITVHQA